MQRVGFDVVGKMSLPFGCVIQISQISYIPNQKSQKFIPVWPKWPLCFYEKDKLTPKVSHP